MENVRPARMASQVKEGTEQLPGQQQLLPQVYSDGADSVRPITAHKKNILFTPEAAMDNNADFARNRKSHTYCRAEPIHHAEVQVGRIQHHSLRHC